MKTIMKCVLALMFALLLAGCGSATEVGNPTGEVPRTMVGSVDASTIPESALMTTESLDMDTASIDPASLSVIALSEEGYEALSPVNSNGYFSLELYVGQTYSVELMRGPFFVAAFSFEQDDQGNRQNRIYVSESGSEINLGTCVYQNGQMVPQNEPRRQMGGQGNGPNS